MGKTFTASYTHLKADPRFNSELVSKFINCLMWDGKKATATRVFYDAMDLIKKRMPDADPVQVFNAAIENVKPSVEVRSRRVGGANYQVPIPVKPKRQLSLSIRWLIAATRSKSGRPMSQRLSEELMAASRREGEAMSKRETTIKMADANKAVSHFAW
jgi:small subunit ribosomal protein S7